MTSSSDFDWQGDDSIVAEHQPALAIYRNARGQTVVRQERAWDEDEDTFILINAENVVSVIYALIDTTDRPMQLTEICDGGWCDVPRPERPAERREPEPEPEAEPERLALPAPDHNREAVAPSLFAGGADAGAQQ